ncbi:MAG: hypothetical protein IKT43_01905, partial [Clostridia bacterium]|nr:hypothetical protein [Clostridia bacterium]
RFWGVLYQVGTLLVSTVLGAFFSVVLMLEYPTSGAVLVGFLLLGALSASGTFALFDAVFSRFLKTEKLWRIKINSFSQDTSTLVVYPAVVHSIAEVEELSERLCRAAYASYAPQKSEEHLSFALLLDLRESKRKTQGEDAVLLHAAENAIARLNEKHGNFFYLFTRDRTRSSDGVFRGWEKKRGAILSLVAFLRGRESELRPLVGDAKRLLGTRYVLTLDADTVLTPRAVHELVGVMAHPLNAPVLSYRNGAVRVERGYGVLQPRIAPTTESAAKTLFSALHRGAGGMTAYEGAAFDRAQTLFSHGHFCGKGLFSVDVFDAVLTDAFPDERILSHDLLEGARLSCGAVLDVVLLDDTPATAREESERAHRWCRGDVQALFFSGFFVRDRYGHRKPNPMSLYYRGALWDNLRRALIPVFSAMLLLLSVFVGISSARVFILAALMPYVVPSLVDFFYLVCTRRAGGVFRRFFSPIFVGILQRFLNLVYDLSGLFFEAKNNLDAILRALWRTCVSGKKTLEWRTAAEGARARDSGVFSYVRRRFVSVLCALFLLAFSSSATVRILAVLSFLHPFFASFLSCKRRERPSLSPRDKKTLLDYAQKSAEFFVNEVGENTSHLPPDHVNFAAATTALRTSPTNIGLYLATLTVLPNFGALTLQQALSRLGKSVSCVERLPKWRGLLYNWYDLKTLAPLSDYVSLVDCGNFLASLAVVRGFLEECKEAGEDVEDLSLRVGRLLDFASLKPLYRPSHTLFAIGYRADEGKFDNAHYDQYMSEARLSSFFAVARAEVPLRHWSALLRPLILRSRHLGLASFSGTAFEYFMPCLFLPIARAGMEEEALCTAAFVQKRAAVKSPFGRVFGVSESAFFATDPSGDYSYRANGIAALALSGSTAGETVISPYSSFLMLPVLGSAAVSNLRRLSKLGLFGTYGFYESAEVGRFGADVVRSVYAHHTGMILLSAANALFDGVVCRRFVKNEEFSAFLPLVSERIPAEGRVHKTDAVAVARPSYRDFVRCKTVGREEVFAQVLPAKDA